MSNFQKCVFLDSGRAKAIDKWISQKIISGVKSPVDMYTEFYTLIAKQGLSRAEQIVYLNSFGKIYTLSIAKTQGIRTPEAEKAMEGVNYNDARAIDQALDKAENIDSFIQYNFIENNLPELLKKKPEAEKTETVNDPKIKETLSEEPSTETEENKILGMQADVEREQELQRIKAVNETLAANSKGNSKQLMADGSGMNLIKDYALKNGIVSLLDYNDLHTVRTFTFDPESKLFHEYAEETLLNQYTESQFIEEFQGLMIMPRNSSITNTRLKEKRTKESKSNALNHAASELKSNGTISVFANSLSEKQRSENLYTIDKSGNLVAGPLTKVFLAKNNALSAIRNIMGNRATFGLIGGTVKQAFPGAKVFLKMSTDKRQEEDIIDVVIKKSNGDEVVLGNFMYVLEKELMRGVNGGTEYLSQLDKLGEEVKEGPKEGLDITDSKYKMSDPYLPGQLTRVENLIYQKDKFRFGTDENKEEAQKLTLKNARKLLQEMGFGISKTYIDKYANLEATGKNKPHFLGAAVIAYSPFLTGDDIDKLIQSEAIDGQSNFDFEVFSKKHNISFLSLDRKSLTFEDYIRLTKDNDTVSFRKKEREGDSTSISDYSKRNSLFNVGQSFYLHYRLAEGIKFMEEKLKSLPDGVIKTRLEGQIFASKAFLFAQKDHYGLDVESEASVEAYRNEVYLITAEDGSVSITAPTIIRQAIEKAYEEHMALPVSKRVDSSQKYAHSLFGYFPSDPTSELYLKKRKWAKRKGNGDVEAESNYMREGGIYGYHVLPLLKTLASKELKAVKVNGKTYSETWSDTTGGDGLNQKLMPMPTFNPVISKKSEGFSNAKVSELSLLNKWDKSSDNAISSQDVSDEYLEMKYMPMMPHFKFDLSGNQGDKRTQRVVGKRTKKVHEVDKTNASNFDNLFNKAVSQSDFDGLGYELSEDGAKEIYDDLLGDIIGELEFINSPIKLKDQFIVGRVGKNLMQLHSSNNKVSERVLRHEVMHRVINESVTEETRQRLYNEAKKAIVKNSNGKIISENDVTDLEADEFMAEAYEETFGRYGVKLVKKLPKILQDLFFFMKSLFDKFRGKYTLFNEVATKLESGYYRNNGANNDGYNGSFLNKSIDSREIALVFDSNLEQGLKTLRKFTGGMVAMIQDEMYGRVVFSKENNFIPNSYAKAIASTKETIEDKILGFYDLDGNEIYGEFDMLTEKEQDLFMPKEIFDLDDINNDFLKSIQVKVKGMSEEADSFFKRLVVYRNFEDIVKKAVPFVKDNNYHLRIDEIEDGIQEGHDKYRSAFERSEIPAMKTFSERVKFFLYNTKINSDGSSFNGELVKREHVDTFFKNSIDRSVSSMDSLSGISTNAIIQSMKQEIDNLKEFEDSLEYKTAKAIFNRFMNLDNPNSFISIGNLSDPQFKFHAISHQSVVNAIISAQKSVITQEFVKVSSTKFGIDIKNTKEVASKVYKNNTNEAVTKHLFDKSYLSSTTSYLLRDDAVKTFFTKSKNYNIGSEGKNVVMTLFGNKYYYPSDQIDRGQKINLNEQFIKDIAFGNSSTKSNGLTQSDIIQMLSDLGISMSRDALNGFIQKDSNRLKLVGVLAHSYFILAKQYMEQKGSFDPISTKVINLVSYGRKDDVLSIIRDSKRKATSNLNEINESEDGKKEKALVYSPTVFNQFFETLGSANKLNAYNSRDNIVYIIEGSKENKDKFPAYLQRKIQEFGKIYAFSKNEANPDEYRDKEYSAIHSNMFKSDLIATPNAIGEMFYFKGINNAQTQRSKEFHELSDREFSRAILNFMIGKSMTSDYNHPMEIQANRGFLPLMNMDKNRRHNVLVGPDGYYFSKTTNTELRKIYQIPFHHAGRNMQQIYDVLITKGLVADSGQIQRIDAELSSQKTTLIEKSWKELQGVMETLYASNPSFVNQLSERKHYVISNKKILLPPLLTERMRLNEREFTEDVKDSYLEFAEYMFSTLKTDKDYDIEFKLLKTQVEDLYKNDAFQVESIEALVNIFQQSKIESDSYAGLSRDEKIKLYHPALMSVFTTYFINQNQITQAFSGDPYMYKADEFTGIKNMHSYMTDYSKRQAGLTTPKIEMTYRETIVGSDFKERRINKYALDPRIRVQHITDTKYNTTENPEAHALLEVGNGKKKEGFKVKANDGVIYSNIITMKKMSNSMGNENGFKIGTVFKGHGYSFDMKKGNINYPKGATQIITAEALDMDEGFLSLILENQLKHAVITGPGIESQSLWQIFSSIASSKGNQAAEIAITDIYMDARNNENGYSMQGDIVDLTIPQATEKGSPLSVNPIIADEFGEPVWGQEESTFNDIGVEGWGAILDLQKDIENSDNDVSLSTQMMFLLGINGDNHFESDKLYRQIKQLSEAEKLKIVDEIWKTLEDDQIPKSGMIRNKTALKKWFLKKVNNNYSSKGDYGLIYDLTLATGTSAISHPVLFEEIFSSVAASISKGILMRMNGFKAIQLPSHNTFMLYESADGKKYTKKEIESMSDKTILEKGIRKRNLSYSKLANGALTDTEIFAPNILANKYLLKEDKQLDLNRIFSVVSQDQILDFQASDSDVLETEAHRKSIIETVVSSQIDWYENPIARGMSKILPSETYRKLMNGELLTLIELSAFSELFANRTIEMNRALYGLISRIPGTGKNSSTPTRIVGFVNSYQNTIFAPVEWMFISGSDYDGDTVQFWNHSGKGDMGDKALLAARGILKKKSNIKEIFSEINFNFMKAQANKGKVEMLKNGKGYVPGSLKTMIELKSNNSTGDILTGINATAAKVHAYSTLTKSRALFLLNDKKLDESIQKIVAKKINVTIKDKATGELLSDGILTNKNGDYLDSKGNYVYKWNETLTNAAIDNAKHLFMKFLGLNKENSGIQQAMAVLGIDPTTVVETIIKNPIVLEAVKEVSKKSDINYTNSSSLTAFIKEKLRISNEVDENGDDVDTNLQDIIEMMSPTNIKNQAKESGEVNQEISVDFTDSDSVYRFLHFLNQISEEINNVRKTVKVTDKIPGLSSDQDFSIQELFKSINKRSGSPKIDTVKALMELLNEMDKANNPFALKEVARAYANSFTVHPLVVLATMPHLREYTKRWLEFTEMKSAHILYGENTQSIINQVKSNLDFISLRNPRTALKVNREMFSFINGAFLEENYKEHVFYGEKYDLSSVSGAVVFKEAFAKKVALLKSGKKFSKNSFMNRLEIKGSDISFPGSESMDYESKIPAREAFMELDLKLKTAFMLYEAVSGNFLYRKGTIVPFMDKMSMEPYLEFLKDAEKSLVQNTDLIIRTSEDGKVFLESFMKYNIELLKSITNREAPESKPFGGKWRPKSAESIPEIWYGDTKLNISEFKIKTESPSVIKELEKIESKIESLKEGLIKMNNSDQDKDLKITKNSDVREKINVLESKKSDLLKRSILIPASKGLPPFKIVRYWDKKKSEANYFVYEVIVKQEDTKVEGIDFDKNEGNVAFRRIYLPIEKNLEINYYRRAAAIPHANSREAIVFDEMDLQRSLFSQINPVTGEYTGKAMEFLLATGGKISVDEEGQINKFSLNNKKGSPEVIGKAKAIAEVINKIFPGVKLNLLKGLPKEYSNKAGFVFKGEVFLNMDRISIDTPMHEFGHIFADLLEKMNPVMFDQLSDLITQTTEYADIEQKYKKFGNTQSDNIKETFVTLLGYHFKNNYSEKLSELSKSDKSKLINKIQEFIDWIKEAIPSILKTSNIRKQYINEKIISKLNSGSTLNDYFNVLGGAVLQGTVITDLSSRQIAELEREYYGPEKTSEKEINEAIAELNRKGILKYYC